MTLDGKIATTTGHAAWVSCADSRARVFAMRARSDAVIVGGNTVRRDNPNLTTRKQGGHAPVRIVMSRTLDLPEVSSFTSSSACCCAQLPCEFLSGCQAPEIVFQSSSKRSSLHQGTCIYAIDSKVSRANRLTAV